MFLHCVVADDCLTSYCMYRVIKSEKDSFHYHLSQWAHADLIDEI